MITFILFLLAIVAILVILAVVTGILVACGGWAIAIVADFALGIFLLIKLCKLIFGKKKGN